jgi:hypothetical protein
MGVADPFADRGVLHPATLMEEPHLAGRIPPRGRMPGRAAKSDGPSAMGRREEKVMAMAHGNHATGAFRGDGMYVASRKFDWDWG